jgi:YjbE family integral membrane protein
MTDISTLVLQGLQIVWVNILLSGDNAVVIAMACRDLDPRRRKWGVLAGSLAAVALRIVFTIFIVELLLVPYIKLISGLLLLWIALRLLTRHGPDSDVNPASSIWGAVRVIALADAVMSLDNVVAVAAAAKNSLPLIVFGIAVSVPLIVFGSTLVLSLLNRFPILVVIGAALLGWVAGEIMVTDPALAGWFGKLPAWAMSWSAATGAGLVLLAAGAFHVFRDKPLTS